MAGGARSVSRSMTRRYAGWSAAALTVTCVAFASPAAAATPTPPAPLPPSASTAPHTSGADGTPVSLAGGALGDRATRPSGTTAPRPQPTPLTAEALKAQLDAAAKVTAALEKSTSQLSGAMKKVNTTAAQSNALLQQLATARETQREATAAATQARQELGVVTKRLELGRAALRAWASAAYAQGSAHLETMSMLEAMRSDPSHAGDRVADLAFVTQSRSDAITEIRALVARQRELTATAAAQQQRATKAADAIAASKKKLDAVLTGQRAEMDRLRTLQAEEVKKAGPLASILVYATTPEAKAAARRLADALAKSGQTVPEAGKPCSDDDGTYPNGMIPASAMCPLWESPGDMLRPRAAAAFNALSQAFAKATGTPLCVTDSYRSLPEQVTVKAVKGRWAATPGTSKHGLGVALDLCGGVQSFGSPQHLWMKQNAPLYGWYHPDWAAAGGSLPEPWHWEFAG